MKTCNTSNPLYGCHRRDFLRGTIGCGAYTMFALSIAAPIARRAFAAPTVGETVSAEPFARLVKLADNVWSVISTPGESRLSLATLSNGGIIAGRDGVLVIEGFMTIAGAQWLRKMAINVTGRTPTHVALTHYHPDHSFGLAGHMGDGEAPEVIATKTTRDLLIERVGQTAEQSTDGIQGTGEPKLIPNAIVTDTTQPTEIDLGGRIVRLVPRMGHTDSDMTIEIDEPRITWCGDLFFNRNVPFFADATPSILGETCRKVFAESNCTFVPGHGTIATQEDVNDYLALLDDLETAARSAHTRGVPASQAWQEYSIPDSLGTWRLFRPDIMKHAFEAWQRELAGAD